MKSFTEKSSKNAPPSDVIDFTIMNPSDHNENAQEMDPAYTVENHSGYSFASTPDEQEMHQTQNDQPCDLRQRKVKTSDSSNQRSDNSKLSSFDTGPSSKLSQKSRHEDENGFAEDDIPAESQQYCETGVNSQLSEQSKNDDAQQFNKHAKCDALVILTVIISAILIKLIIDYLF